MWCLQCISKVAEESLLTATQQTSVAAQGTQVLQQPVLCSPRLLTEVNGRRRDGARTITFFCLFVLPICLSATASAHVVGEG